MPSIMNYAVLGSIRVALLPLTSGSQEHLLTS
jgi:hypothetical protein